MISGARDRAPPTAREPPAFMGTKTGSGTVLQGEKARKALRDKATSDPFVSHGIRLIIIPAAVAFEASLVADRLALISAFHEVRYCGVELVRMREAREYEAQNPEPREIPEHRIRNDAVNESHVVALESRRKTAATALIITLDRLFDAYWMKLGLPEWSVRGGPVIGGDVTAFELIHLCGNYLRHVHEWLTAGTLPAKARENIERLQLGGFDFRDDAMLARVVEALPYGTFTDFEEAVLDFVEAMAYFTQEKSISVWASTKGAKYAIRFNDYDDKNGFRELAVSLNNAVGEKWNLPANPGAKPPATRGHRATKATGR